MTIDYLRGLVRPMVTLAVVLVLCALTIFQTIVERKLPDYFLGLAGPIVGYWFGSRKAGGTP
ncbi:MAG TPA: hypothetical protein VFH17_05035 [Coriobacteriia bacterium]|nr:hypothetical protein [Coriobacteriia bacterium]